MDDKYVIDSLIDYKGDRDGDVLVSDMKKWYWPSSTLIMIYSILL